MSIATARWLGVALLLLAPLSSAHAGLFDGASGGSQPPKPNAPAASQPAPRRSPDQVFTDKSVVRMGFLIVETEEAEVRETIKKLQAVKGRLGNEVSSRAELDRAEKSIVATLKQLSARSLEANAQLARHPKDNEWIGTVNALIALRQQEIQKLADIGDRRSKLADSRSEYIGIILEKGGYAEAAATRYESLAKDTELQTAIQQFNQSSVQKVRLGPSGIFTEGLAFLRKCKADVVTDAVLVETSHNVPVLQVVLNERVTRPMIWDSGASLVSLSAETADELGLKLSDYDGAMGLTLADGRHVQARIAILHSIRVGAFTVENVECVIMPPGKDRSDDLLGGTFQSHFVCRLDLHAGQLHLTRLDPVDATAKPVATNSGQPTTQPLETPTPPRPPDPAPLAASHAVNLLKLIDPDKDAVSGTWNLEGGHLVVSGGGKPDRLRIPYAPPNEYDFHIQFKRNSGDDSVCQIMAHAARNFMWGNGTYHDTIHAFASVNGNEFKNNVTKVLIGPDEKLGGQMHNSVVQVRKDYIAAYVDGRLASRHVTDFSDMTLPGSWAVGGGSLGLATWGTPATFYVIEVTEVTGTGQALPHLK